jgi:hypothetical protein
MAVTSFSMTPDEIRALANRLEVRAASILMMDQPEQRADTARAAALLRYLLCSGAIHERITVGPAVEK